MVNFYIARNRLDLCASLPTPHSMRAPDSMRAPCLHFYTGKRLRIPHFRIESSFNANFLYFLYICNRSFQSSLHTWNIWIRTTECFSKICILIAFLVHLDTSFGCKICYSKVGQIEGHRYSSIVFKPNMKNLLQFYIYFSSYGTYTGGPHLRCHQIMPRCPIFSITWKRDEHVQKTCSGDIYILYTCELRYVHTFIL